jgi:hypothetical protein
MNLQEQISRMKSMMGMITESHKDCGIIYEPELKKDLESTNIFDMVVNDDNDSMVYIWDKNDAELIDCIFYGIGDC